MSPFAALKADLLAEWDRRTPVADATGPGEAVLQALPAVRPPRGGLALGDGVDPATGRRRLELRVNAAGGPDRARAEQFVRRARLEGFEALLRVFKARPSIPLRPPAPAQAAAPLLGGQRRPLHLGASVAHERGSAGTLGAFVMLPDNGLGVVSCSHVLARAFRTRVRKRDPIQQPGAPDPVAPAYRIGELTEHFTLFEPSKDDNLDAAVALLDKVSANEAEGNVLPNAPCVPPEFRGRAVGSPLNQDEINPGENVVKVGRTTGFTRGRVQLVDVLNFKPNLGGDQPYTFGSVVEVAWLMGERPFTDLGDSGSLVLTEDGLRPVGIHFCAVPLTEGGWVSYLIPWWRIRAKFELELA